MYGREFRLIAYLLACFAGCADLLAQAPEPSSTSSIKTRAEDVLLDVVVRDKKSHLVTDLKPEDFEILDNGVPKKIDGFRLVQGEEAISGGGTRTQLDPLRQIRLITMVFQSSTPDARRLAYQGAMDLLKNNLPQNVFIGVLKVDFKIQIVQGYTNDISLLRKAVDTVARGSSTDFTRDAQLLKEQLERQLGPDFYDPLIAQTHRSSGAAGGSIGDSEAMRILLAMLAGIEKAAVKETGRLDISSLLDVIREQYRLPGRKTVLYFTEKGFKIPQGTEQWVRNLISIANRSNVSLYAIDTSGLTSSDPNHDATSQLHAAGAIYSDGVMSGQDDRVGDTDAVIEATRANPQMNLSYIAESTGGALIANMNDFRAPLRKAVEDLETHYEISYAPEINNYDGSFHKVSVKLKDSSLHVQSRAGYFALPPTLGEVTELKAYEVPLLEALSSPELPRDFAFHTAAMHFRDEKNRSQYVLAIDIPFSEITFLPKDKSFEGRFAYEALLKNDAGEVVRKFRNEVPLLVPAEKLDALKRSHYIYTESFEVPPGHYSLETAVLDSEKDTRLSARKASLIVPAGSRLQLSSVIFVRNMSDVKPAEDSKSDNPLQVGTRIISPDLNPVASRDTADNLSFYFVAYTDPSASAPPTLAMELSQAGVVLGATTLDLGKPDDRGRIPYLGGIPTGALKPGDYTVRFVLQQGTAAAQEAAFFRITSTQTTQVPSTPTITPEFSSGKLPQVAAVSEPEIPPTEIPAYCSQLAGSAEHSPALESVCEFSLRMRKNLPDVTCDREVERYWSSFGAKGFENHNDVVISKVAYRHGQEYYSDLRIDGQPADSATVRSHGTWSGGEFAIIPGTAFQRSSKASFRFVKEDTIDSRSALLFEFKVQKQHNRTYFLNQGSATWFPAYHGKIWVEKASLRLIKLERETAYDENAPITRMKTSIEYDSIALGDGTNFVLPCHAEVLICTRSGPNLPDNCSHNVITFSNWHKFRATTNIVFNSVN